MKVEHSQPPVEQKNITTELSVISIVFGILGIFCLIIGSIFNGNIAIVIFIAGIISAFVGITFGIIALIKIKQHKNNKGKIMATIGLTCGGLIILIGSLLFGLIYILHILGGHFGGAID